MVKIAYTPPKSYDFKSVIATGDLAIDSADLQGPLSVSLQELPIQPSEEFEVGNGKNYLHPKRCPIFQSVGKLFG